MKKNILTLSLLIAAAFMAPAAEAQKSVTLFAHGLGGHPQKINGRIHDQIDNYKYCGYIAESGEPFGTYTVNNPENPLENCSLGQIHELDNTEQAITRLAAQNPETIIVFQGVSLGAATGINFAGTRPELLKKYNVKGGIFESPFAHVRDIPDNKACGLTRILPNILLKPILRLCAFPNHDLTGMQPIKSAATIPHDFPVLIIASKEDTLIPWQSSKKIYDQLVKSGHKCAHFLLVDGHHANIFFHSRENQKTIMCVIHAFRKKYNLGDYDDTIAEHGQAAFAETQPPLLTSHFESLRSLSSATKNAATQAIRHAAQPRTPNTRWQKIPNPYI